MICTGVMLFWISTIRSCTSQARCAVIEARPFGGRVVDFLYFVLLIGALVLVHELGDFAAARAFGVKVLTFSIGFGPTLVRIRGRETTYRLGLLPFGGFVKLLEESPRRPGDAIPDDE